MNNEGEKFVNFRLYCPKCKDYESRADEDPCNDCLEHPVNMYSEKPVRYTEKEVK